MALILFSLNLSSLLPLDLNYNFCHGSVVPFLWSPLPPPPPPPLRAGGSYPAGGDPLRLVLRLPHRRQHLDARVLQLVVNDHMVKELAELRLDLTGGFFNLLEVFILLEDTTVRRDFLI